jgi:hypothetical protein
VDGKADLLSEGEIMKCRDPSPVVFLASFSLFAIACQAGAAGSAYTFSINGEPVTPQHYSLNGDASVFAPGDVIYVGDKQFDYGGLYMTLGEERDCRFVTASDRTGAAPRRAPRDSRVFLELPDGRRKVVGLKVSWTVLEPNEQTPGQSQGARKPPSFNRIPYNPLDSLSPEEIHGLWGIAFVQWPQGIEQTLAHIDTDRVCLTVDDRAGVGGRAGSFFGGPVFPPIPTKTRYLVVEKSVSPGLRDFSHFSQLRDLRFLHFRSFPSEPLDAGLICQNTGLRYLDLSGCGIPNYPRLAALTELRLLNISGCREIDNLEFVKDIRQLRVLLMGMTRISSLSPLDNSNSIREIHAGMTDVRDLPQGDLPSLRVVNLTSTKVDAQAVTRFRKAHPACAVQHGWADSLHQAVQGATRLRVRSGGTCHRQIEEEKTRAEITQPNVIEHFLDGIHIDEAGSNFYCGCCGNPTFEFYAGDRLLAMVGYHHGRSLRWAGGSWPTDALLTESSQAFTVAWLAQHGVDGPRREVQERQRREDEGTRRQRRYGELITPQTVRAISDAMTSRELRNDNAVGDKRQRLTAEAFRKQEKDARTSIELYLRLLGVTANDGWNRYLDYEGPITKHLLPRFQGPELAQGTAGVMSDEEGMMGAARWLLGEDGWRNLDESDRERLVPPLAQRALQHRYMDTRKRVMNTLCEIGSPWAAESLRRVLARPTDPNWAPPQVKYGWRIKLVGGGEVRSDECSDAVWAAFCLAKMGDAESLPAIERLAQEAQGTDKDLFNQALQLLRKNARQAPRETK